MPITANQSFWSYMYHMPTIHAFEETEAWHLNFEILACGGICKCGWGRPCRLKAHSVHKQRKAARERYISHSY